MKKLIYLTGIVCMNIFLAGAIFKVNHWPAAGILITTGLGIFSLLFLPAAFINAFKGEADKSRLWMYISGFLCIFINVVGALFKVQHYPGAHILLMISIPLPFVVFLPVFVVNHFRNKEQNLPGFLGVMFLLTYIVVFSAFLAMKR